ncbi:hypothetical protein QUB80_05760 [Chlorogloeopsis sp. ULAP01]|uniref:hypothetical protein n=1 Tax=Chlorogloeopsis sp. ULAP01 TaxID=3056483 RepID=UPI0025AA9E11|nr:hypothetical protein [Chlorogloeopsis sp. ULAP01]MDM9380206.1 hypothetical protein [Chlorogloeopsis sp. ULAP01]
MTPGATLRKAALRASTTRLTRRQVTPGATLREAALWASTTRLTRPPHWLPLPRGGLGRGVPHVLAKRCIDLRAIVQRRRSLLNICSLSETEQFKPALANTILF